MASAQGPVRWLGATTTGALRLAAEGFALLYGALAILAFVRIRGLRVVYEVALAQTVFTGVQGLPLVGLGSLALGTLVISQTAAWPIDAAAVSAGILAGDAVPLLVAFAILGRSGTAITASQPWRAPARRSR